MDAQQIPETWRDWWSERAAIMEVEGGLSRADAELAAFTCLQEMLEAYVSSAVQQQPSPEDVTRVSI